MEKKVFCEALVISCREVKRNSKIFLLELSRGELKAEPGQFMMFAPLSPLSPTPRPFAMFDIDNRSIYFLIKVVGENTRLITASKKGDTLKIIGPCGKPLKIDPDIESYILVTGGTGEAALMYPAKTLKNKGKKIKVLLGGKDTSQIAKEKEFKKCGCVKTITENGGKVQGLVTHLLEDELKKDNGKSAIIACGPKPMLKAVYWLAKKYGNKCQVMLEEMMACGVGSCKSCPIFGKDGTVKLLCKEGPIMDAYWVDWEKLVPPRITVVLPQSPKKSNPLETVLCGQDGRQLKLNYPIMDGSGCLDVYAIEDGPVDIKYAGALVAKGVSYFSALGNPTPRVWEAVSMLLNSIGLQNIGIKDFVRLLLPRWLAFGKPVIVNIFGQTIKEYGMIAEYLADTAIAGIELNVSCPNKKQKGKLFGLSPKATIKTMAEVRKKCRHLFIITKLTPMAGDIVEIARGAIDGGSDAISLINTIRGMIIDPYTRKMIISGGMSGPAIRPRAVQLVNELHDVNLGVPIIGMGGITSGEDAVQFFLAGANAIATGTELFPNPNVMTETYHFLRNYLKQNKINSIQDMVGQVI